MTIHKMDIELNKNLNHKLNILISDMHITETDVIKRKLTTLSCQNKSKKW